MRFPFSSHRPLRLLLPLGLTVAALMAGNSSTFAAAAAPRPDFLERFGRLDQLPRFHDSVRIGMVSSYDRTGGNDDGFSGKHSYLRQEGDRLVIAELAGPGVIYRIWTPTPTSDVFEFYFDGEASPRLRLPFRELFTGNTSPFVGPLVGRGSGGNWSYVPIAYAKSLKIVARAERVQFIQINYATYSPDAAIASYSADAPEFTAALKRGNALFSRTGEDLSDVNRPAGATANLRQERRTLAPGRSVTLFEATRGGRILGLRLRPASAFAGPDRAVVLRMTWDGSPSPAVRVPAGDFFGYSWGDPAARSLLVGTHGDTCYSYFPMPFEKSARIELVSEKTAGEPIQIEAEIVHADAPRQPDEGFFHAAWRRENPTAVGKPFTFVDIAGRGHVVGVTLQAQGNKPGDTYYFEGDDRAIIDGELAIHGTGSEDFFSGGWYDVPSRWEVRASHPLTGCLDYLRPQGRTGGYRFLLGDAYPFRRSLTLDIEHWPTGNEQPTDYTGMTYFYLEAPQREAAALPPVAERTVTDPAKLVFSPGWYQPSVTFSIQNATLTKKVEKIADKEHRSLSLRASEGDVFESQHHLALFCEVPRSGRYRVSIEMMQGPEQGAVELVAHSIAAGPRRSGFAAGRGRSHVLPMGELELRAGVNRIYFTVTPSRPDQKTFGFDLVTLELERLP